MGAMNRDCSRALIVDDEPQVRNALARSVRGAGLTPVVAASAEEGLALALGGEFDVVLTDVTMPGMGGLAMLQQLSPILPRARFLVVTGTEHVSPQSLPRGHHARVLRKPWSEEELVSAVRGERLATPSSPPPPLSSDASPENVLLIEDDSGDAVLFQTALRLAYPGQFVVHHASSIAEAAELAGRVSFDVVALDLGLGETTGLRTITRVQSEVPHLGLVVFSGQDDPDFALQTVQAGAQDYLVKGKVDGGTIGRALRYAGERKRAELRLADIAFHDQLTGLANRTLFRQRVAQALARARRSHGVFAVLLLDIDRFKSVNDAFGHDAGDVFLTELSVRLREATRDTDIVARLGGDEFAILAEPIGSDGEVEILARRVLKVLCQPLRVAGVQLLPTASIGGALYPPSGEDGDALLAAADAAMYVVKGSGRNGFRMHGVQMTEEATRRVELESNLRRAVELEQFTLFYQPQLKLDGTFFGAEALLRWPQPDGTCIPACDFAPMLEDTGLIIELGPWIVRSACQQLAAWRAQGLSIDRIAINLSARQFIKTELADMILECVSEAGLVPADIELELTETVFIDDDQGAERTLHELRGCGFSIALDDFGTGYSSLGYLRRFPIDVLKIDRCFVADIASQSECRNLVGGIIQLAKRLGIEVVAEGVETAEQLEVLRVEGCQHVQGYLLGRGMAPADFEQVALARQARPPVLLSAS